ncbi:hypothetical protein A2U01_0010416, partial [Trifolium medium]|nr:hypothetical protein [Trifolium medium]
MDNPQVQEGVYTSELGQILRKHIDEKVKPFRKRCREIVRGKLEFTPVPEALRRFPGIESVLSKLGGWEVTGVKRDLADICDT